MVSNIEEIRTIRLLSNLKDNELNDIAKILLEKKYRDGQYIFRQDDSDPRIFFVKKGKVKITISNDQGREVGLAVMGSGDFFGELSVLTGMDRSADVIAVEDCELYILSGNDFNRHVLNNSGLIYELAKELALRVRKSTSKIAEIALLDVVDRIYHTLIDLGMDPDGKAWFKRPTQSDIASMVGTSREMVTRGLKVLEEVKRIEIKGKEVRALKN